MIVVLMQLFLALAIGCGVAVVACLVELIFSARRPKWSGRRTR